MVVYGLLFKYYNIIIGYVEAIRRHDGIRPFFSYQSMVCTEASKLSGPKLRYTQCIRFVTCDDNAFPIPGLQKLREGVIRIIAGRGSHTSEAYSVRIFTK